VKRLVRRMVVIFPFEESIYREAGVPVSFVGHPLVDMVRPQKTREQFAAENELDPSRPIVALLPGSRRSEIERNFPTVLEACAKLARAGGAMEGIQFVHAAAPRLGNALWAPFRRPDLRVKRVEGATYEALNAADCAVVASGTATVEAALVGTPMIVVYRVAPATAMVLRRMLHTPDIGMVNLIAGRRVATELVQGEFTAEAVVRETRRLLESSSAREEAKAGLAEVRTRLGPGGAIERAADIFAGML
jgi:lipid-A-disaccharide synthase